MLLAKPQDSSLGPLDEEVCQTPGIVFEGRSEHVGLSIEFHEERREEFQVLNSTVGYLCHSCTIALVCEPFAGTVD